MVRTQIQLTEAQAARLKELAATERRSMADLIRESVDVLLASAGSASPAERRARALAVVGRYHGGPKDLSTRHDRYVDAAAQVSVFVDTSALVAVLHRSDANHLRAARQWRSLIEGATELVTTNYVLVETAAMLQNRFGVAAVRDLAEAIAPLLHVTFITEEGHASAMEALLAANRRQLSLVDCASFVTMRRLGVTKVFAFDPHFAEQGFEPV